MNTLSAHTEFLDKEALYAEVVLPLPLPKLYTYRIPSEWFEMAMPGMRVFVPFGARKVYTGIIVRVSTRRPEKYEALNLIAVIDDNPLITEQQLGFWQWIADYYMCSLGDVMSAALPAGFKLASETYIAIQEDIDYDTNELDEREVLILKALEGKEKMRISELETLLKSKSSFVKIIKSLYDRQFIVMFEDISETYKPKLSQRIALNGKLSEAEIEKHLQVLEKKAHQQFQAFLALLSVPGSDAEKSELIKRFNLQASVFKALEKKGLITSYTVEVARLPQRHEENENYHLSQAQEKAVEQIQAYFKEAKNVLLHGITASGKTFVYIELIKQALAKGQSVLFLIPELALTQQLIQRLEHYFGNEMMVSHSRFSKNEKVEIWNKVSQGQIKLLLGSRSALFMPLQNLGLIIVDEEHEPAFKQYEKAPRYQARDAAMVLALQTKAHVLLGSASPSVESYQHAIHGKYGLVELTEYFGEVIQTEIKLADIKEETKAGSMTGIFTKELLSRLKRLQEEQAQALLFQNRKGYVPMLECHVCGWVSKCVNCDIALTYYKYSNNLRCHYCGYQQGNISKCQACGNNSMEIQGYGTERVSEELKSLVPELRVLRFDQDSTRKKHAFSKILDDFEKGAADVMVGTQIAIKGIDYGNVVLAAVINADHLLNFPDFRSHERCFQLLSQLAGRAGRREKKGLMLIQTRQPEHPVIQAVLRNDYKGFFEDQIREREQFNYAPFSKMIKLTLKHKDPVLVQAAAAEFALLLKKQLGDLVLGPETPFISKIRNLYIRNLLIKFDPERYKPSQVKSFILKTFDFLVSRDQIKGLQFAADVDC